MIPDTTACNKFQNAWSGKVPETPEAANWSLKPVSLSSKCRYTIGKKYQAEAGSFGGQCAVVDASGKEHARYNIFVHPFDIRNQELTFAEAEAVITGRNPRCGHGFAWDKGQKQIEALANREGNGNWRMPVISALEIVAQNLQSAPKDMLEINFNGAADNSGSRRYLSSSFEDDKIQTLVVSPDGKPQKELIDNTTPARGRLMRFVLEKESKKAAAFNFN